MLSGKAPFHSQSGDGSPESIVSRIKQGDFDLNRPEWNNVSSKAKKIIKGILKTFLIFLDVSVYAKFNLW